MQLKAKTKCVRPLSMFYIFVVVRSINRINIRKKSGVSISAKTRNEINVDNIWHALPLC